MKKLFAMLMAVVMIFSLATVAFAAEDLSSKEHVTDVVLHKLYKITGAEDASAAKEAAQVYPHETLSFVSTPATTNPDGGAANLTIAPLTVSGPEGSMAITLPVYTQVGKYDYTITETAGTAQAAVYSGASINLTVLVTYNDDHTALNAVLYLVQKTENDEESYTEITKEDGSKVYKLDTFVNEYSVGKLEVSKEVEGNLADQSVEFVMTVKFTSVKPVLSDITVVDGSTGAVSTVTYGNGWTEQTVTINVKHGETVTFYNIPTGVTYVVEEDAKHLAADTSNGSNVEVGYTVSYDAKKAGTIAVGTASTVVTNNKSTEVETGIVLDSMPYVVILAVACFGMFAMMTKKRYEV